MCLGWSLNWEKSYFIPSQRFKHLGFNFDTESMTISCPNDKVERLQEMCRVVVQEEYVTVHKLERMVQWSLSDHLLLLLPYDTGLFRNNF